MAPVSTSCAIPADTFGAVGTPPSSDLVSWDPRWRRAERAGGAFKQPRFLLRGEPQLDVGRGRTGETWPLVETVRRRLQACERAAPAVSVDTGEACATWTSSGPQWTYLPFDYLGYSYGTYLGAAYAERYPNRVRCDGARRRGRPVLSVQPLRSSRRPPDSSTRSTRSWIGCRVERQVRVRTWWKSEGGVRRPHEESHEAGLVPAEIDGEQRSLGIGEANIGVATALYAGDREQGWDTLGKALNDAAHRRRFPCSSCCRTRTRAGKPVAATATSLRRSTRSAVSTVRRRVPRPRSGGLAKRGGAGRLLNFGASTVWLGLPCTYWPVRPDGRWRRRSTHGACRRSSWSATPTTRPRRMPRRRR